MSEFHLAQANFARMKASLEDPIMSGFVEQLDYINSLADNAEGFVWRLQNEEGDATDIRVFDDDLILFNMSVWESSEALFEYVYRSDHGKVFADRHNWFLKFERPSLVMWWVPAGALPTVEDAVTKLKYLEQHGPTKDAFTFKEQFDPTGQSASLRSLKRNENI